MQRRALLSSVFSGGVLMAGCLGVGEEQGEGTTVEIIPRNHTAQQIALDVAVYARDDSLLLEHSYSLPAGHSDESQGVENRVSHLFVSLNGGDQRRHEYAPDVDICSRDGEDVQIIVESDGLNFAYSC